jgi:alanine racemase
VPVRALARVNLAAIERNLARLRCTLTSGALMGAVVKADGYGHGAVAVAQAAKRAGTEWLAVATAEEAAQLRSAGLEGPVLVMGALTRHELAVALGARADVVAWTEGFLELVHRELDSWPGQGSGARPVGVHVKLDTGMGRLGTKDPQRALRVAERAQASGPGIVLRGAMTHFATADDDQEFLSAQLARFEPFVAKVRERWPRAIVHAANSAATLNAPRSHFDLVRCGIAVYGCDPMGLDPVARGLEPALELSSYVAAVKPAQPGDTLGYGRSFAAERHTLVATVPIGYGDGVRRGLSNNCEVLIRGRRYPVAGTLSMDNLTVDLGPQSKVEVGDRVTLIGADGAERQTAEDLARRLDTISYEIVCGISSRVPRTYHRDGEAV